MSCSIFISYRRSDNEGLDKEHKWFDRLLEYLKPLTRQRPEIICFSDKDISPGEKWDERIRSQAESATVAVLLLTQSYLNSDYVCNVELPIFLDRADEGDLEVLPIVVRRGTYDKVKIQRRNKKDGSTSHLLSSFQFVNGPNEPLIDMTLGEQDKVLEKVARHIIRSVAFEAGEGDREQVADEAKQRSDVTAYPNEPQQSPSDVNGTDPSLRELRQEAIKKEEEFGQVSEARYNIVVLGQAGAGKSSLINYLFGKNIRETGTGKPVTLRGFHD